MSKQTINTIILLILVHILCSFQLRDQVFEQIRNAFLHGNAGDLALFFEGNIELKMDGYQTDYSQVQAVYILKDFFKEHPPKNFKYLKQENFKKDLIYLVGTYQSVSDEFQVFMMVQEINDNYIIRSLDLIQME